VGDHEHVTVCQVGRGGPGEERREVVARTNLGQAGQG
jgi:hypothetical protein